MTMHRLRPVALAAGTAAAAALLFPAIADAGTAPTPNDTFTFSGAAETFTVPDHVCAILVHAIGAEGGDDGFAIVEGGIGGEIESSIGVSPGDSLTIGVGGRGGDGEFTGDDPGGAGGFGISNTEG